MENPYKRSRSPLSESRGRPADRRQPQQQQQNPLTMASSTSYVSRWILRPSENVILNLIGVPTTVIGTLSTEQLDAYQILVRIEEITTKLKINDYMPHDSTRLRSPSPPPEYDANGKRTNTRQVRYKKKLEDERHTLIEYAMKSVAQYRPPVDYKKPTKTMEKVYLPVRDHPDVNFIGLLLGPRGNTLKKLQQESGARIAIRGKGSVKGGKNPAGITSAQNNLEDDLHCLITSESEAKITSAVSLVNSVIEKAVNAPVGQNDLKRSQLRDLAVLNGTLRVQQDDGRPCPNCGMPGHRRWACPNKDSKNVIICNFCGNPGHIERDCRYKYAPRSSANNIDNEINEFMKDLNGDSGVSQDNNEQQQIELPPWKKPRESIKEEDSNKYYYEMRSKMVVPNKRKGPPGLSSATSSNSRSQPPPPPPAAMKQNLPPPPPAPPAPPAHISKPTPPPPPPSSS